MRRYLFLLILIVESTPSYTQNIEIDIFDNLKYESMDGFYKSNLEKNVFGDLVFSDNMGNEVILKKKYIVLEYGELAGNSEAELDIFRSMIHTHMHDRKYKATYSVDITNNIVIEDNRNNKVEIGVDIFGNESYEETKNGVHRSMKRNLSGALEYEINNDNATLYKDIINNWTYKDSLGNEFKFSNETWRRLKNRFETEENIFHYLINEFLHI